MTGETGASDDATGAVPQPERAKRASDGTNKREMRITQRYRGFRGMQKDNVFLAVFLTDFSSPIRSGALTGQKMLVA